VDEHLRCCARELVQTLGERRGVRPLTQSGRSSHVGEHNSDVDFDAAGRQTIEAGLTEIRALTGGLAPQEADYLAAHTAKGVQAKLAAGVVGKVTKDPLRELQGFVTLDE
jgi:hypothetical protein